MLWSYLDMCSSVWDTSNNQKCYFTHGTFSSNPHAAFNLRSMRMFLAVKYDVYTLFIYVKVSPPVVGKKIGTKIFSVIFVKTIQNLISLKSLLSPLLPNSYPCSGDMSSLVYLEGRMYSSLNLLLLSSFWQFSYRKSSILPFKLLERLGWLTIEMLHSGL